MFKFIKRVIAFIKHHIKFWEPSAPADEPIVQKPKHYIRPSSCNPAGSKLLRKWYKHKHGRRGTYEQALEWYTNLP